MEQNVGADDNDFWLSFAEIQSLIETKKLSSMGEVINILLAHKLCKTNENNCYNILPKMKTIQFVIYQVLHLPKLDVCFVLLVRLLETFVPTNDFMVAITFYCDDIFWDVSGQLLKEMEKKGQSLTEFPSTTLPDTSISTEPQPECRGKVQPEIKRLHVDLSTENTTIDSKQELDLYSPIEYT